VGRYPGLDGMKTGFICASGFNVVATATRNGKRLIAVVLGAPSSPARAVKAAELLERGFTQNPLGWLTPALGSVNNLTPVNADPPNLHDSVCGPHKKRTPAEEEEEAGSEPGPAGGVDTPFSALLSSLRAPTPKGAALLSDYGSEPPVVVYTGPTRTPGEIAKLNAIEPGPVHKKKAGAKTAAAKADDKAADDKADEKPDSKAAGHKSKSAAKTSSVADKPEKPKKPQQAEPAAKPATTQ
jgi:D-alanyl-D-alanine carboxypeptidase